MLGAVGLTVVVKQIPTLKVLLHYVIFFATCLATSLQNKLLTEIKAQLHFAIFSETFRIF